MCGWPDSGRFQGINMTIWYDWRDPEDDSVPGARAFGLIHCLANDTSTLQREDGSCMQTTPDLSSAGMDFGYPKASFVGEHKTTRLNAVRSILVG